MKTQTIKIGNKTLFTVTPVPATAFLDKDEISCIKTEDEFKAGFTYFVIRIHGNGDDRHDLRCFNLKGRILDKVADTLGKQISKKYRNADLIEIRPLSFK